MSHSLEFDSNTFINTKLPNNFFFCKPLSNKPATVILHGQDSYQVAKEWGGILINFGFEF
jgi:hypothetical protein